jgi:hypothetical protein
VAKINNISISDHPVGNWCPVCLLGWTPEMVPVRIRFNDNFRIICGQCARMAGFAASKEQRRRRRESEAVRGKKGKGQ